jgi:poly-beta-1,6-N-acetyl-D-glucosamine synthase
MGQKFVTSKNHLKMNHQFKATSGQNFIAVFGLLLVVTLFSFSQSLKSLWVKELIEQFIFAYFSISLFRLLFFVAGEVLSFKITTTDISNCESQPFVSILLPAFNEEKMIASVLENFNHLNYSNFEVIVIDDGSKDNTYLKAQLMAAQLKFNVRVFKKENGGKASALNFGIEKAEGELILCMDADTTLSADTLKNSVYEFSKNKRLGALAGVVKIAELNSWLSYFQNLEYLIGHFQRKTLSHFGKVTIIPGPIGLFRKKAILSVGGYEKEDTTFAEDAELTLRMIAAGWDIKSRSDMISYTEGPKNLDQLMRQRYRWSRGLYQALFKNLNQLVFSYKDSNLFVLIFLLWEQLILPLFDFAILISVVAFFVFGYHYQALTSLYLVLVAMDIIISILACRNEKNLILWSFVSFVSRFTYINLLLVWKICSLYDEWKQLGMNWDKIERRGSIRIIESELTG